MLAVALAFRFQHSSAASGKLLVFRLGPGVGVGKLVLTCQALRSLS